MGGSMANPNAPEVASSRMVLVPDPKCVQKSRQVRADRHFQLASRRRQLLCDESRGLYLPRRAESTEMSRRPRTLPYRVRTSFSLSEFDFLKLQSLAALRNVPVVLVSRHMVEEGLRNTNEHDLLEGIREARTARLATNKPGTRF
jgi:hypothetical protein